jgi:histidinol-phosphate aminotransferase
VAQALRNFSTEEIAVYPEYDGLREALLQNLVETGCRPGLKLDQIGLFNGVDAAIHAVFQAYGDAGETLLTTAPTFGYYSPCAGMQGMTIEAIPYQGETFDFPLAAIQEALAAHAPRLLLICNPNNPTGTRLAADEVIALAASAPGTLVVVDELYEAFTGDSVLPSADFTATPNLLVFRSLAKTAGLAGLRIGFAIGHADVVDRVSRVTGPLRRQQRGCGLLRSLRWLISRMWMLMWLKCCGLAIGPCRRCGTRGCATTAMAATIC